MRSIYTFILLISSCLLCSLSSQAQHWDWGIASNPGFKGVVESSPTAVGLNGDVYSAGVMFSDDTISFGPFTISDTGMYNQLILLKADAAGDVQWVVHTENTYCQPIAIATDPVGDVYVLGNYFDTGCNIGSFHLSNNGAGVMYFIFRVSAAGTVLWAQNVASSNLTNMGGIGIDAESYVYVTGCFSTLTATIGSTTLVNSDPAGNSPDVLIAKYDNFGNNVWAKSFGGPENDLGSYIAVHPTGTFYISGQFSSPAITIGASTLIDSMYTGPVGANYFRYYARFDGMGNPIWAQTPYRHVNILDIKTDAAGNFYIGGSVDSTIILGKDTIKVTGYQNALVAKYDGTGQLLWASTAYAKSYCNAYSLAIDDCENVWAAGATDSTVIIDGHAVPYPAVYSDRMYLAAYDHCGRYIPGTGTQLGSGGDDRLAIALDHSGHLYFGGDYTYIPMVFGADSLHAPINAIQELFLLARYTYGHMPCNMDSCCYITPYANFTDTGIGTVNFSYAGATAYDSVRWHFGDSTTSSLLNPTHTFAAGHTYHVCLVVYTICGADSMCKDITVPVTGTTNITYEADVNIYPNPSSGQYTIHSNTGLPTGARADIYDVTGKHMGAYPLAGSNTIITLAGYAPGIYQCSITVNDTIVIKKQIVIK